MQNAIVWVKENRIRILSIMKDGEDQDRFVQTAHGSFHGPVEDDLEIHGKGTIGTVLAGYSGITTFYREFTGSKARVEAVLKKFESAASKAGFARKGVIRMK